MVIKPQWMPNIQAHKWTCFENVTFNYKQILTSLENKIDLHPKLSLIWAKYIPKDIKRQKLSFALIIFKGYFQ